MALIKKLGYCVGSKTTSIDFEEKKIPEKVEYKVIVKVSKVIYESYIGPSWLKFFCSNQ